MLLAKMMNEYVLKACVYVGGRFKSAKEGLKKIVRPNHGVEDPGEMMIDKVGGMAIIVVVLGLLLVTVKAIMGNETDGILGLVNTKITEFFN